MIITYFIGCIFSFIFCLYGVIGAIKQEIECSDIDVTIEDLFKVIFWLIGHTLLSWGIIVWFLYINRDRKILHFKKRNYDKD